MFEIKSYTVEKIEDPFGILSGERYEFFLEIDVDEEDELYSEHGMMLRILFVKDGEKENMLKYEFIEQQNEEILDFEMEDEEEQMVFQFCRDHISPEDEANH